MGVSSRQQGLARNTLPSVAISAVAAIALEGFAIYNYNHDVARFQNGQSDDKRLRVALAYIFSCEGVPCVYYGTEQGFSGAGESSSFRPRPIVLAAMRVTRETAAMPPCPAALASDAAKSRRCRSSS